MRYLRLLLIVATACGASACYVVSLSGIADASSTAFDEALLGRWTSADDDVDVVLARDEWQAYTVVLRDRFGEQKFTGRLALLGKSQYLDVTLHSGTDPGPVLLPVHIIGRLALADRTLTIELLDYEWFRRRMKKGLAPVAAALDSRESVVLTASSSRLRRWLVAGPQPGAFSEFMTLTRVAETPPGARVDAR